jgi:hypothetical protein
MSRCSYWWGNVGIVGKDVDLKGEKVKGGRLMPVKKKAAKKTAKKK